MKVPVHSMYYGSIMDDLSLHIMDIIENSVRAASTAVLIAIKASVQENVLDIHIQDNGKGMDEKQLRECEDPFFTTKASKKTGLGISLLKQASTEAAGTFSLTSEKGKGTAITATFQYDHLDRKPLGDIAKTIYIAIAAFPSVDFSFFVEKDREYFELNTAEIKKELEDIPITTPDVLKTLKELIGREITALGID